MIGCRFESCHSHNTINIMKNFILSIVIAIVAVLSFNNTVETNTVEISNEIGICQYDLIYHADTDTFTYGDVTVWTNDSACGEVILRSFYGEFYAPIALLINPETGELSLD